MSKPRLFFVVSYIYPGGDTKKIFATQDEAMSYFNNTDDEESFNYKLEICELDNYYKDGKFWNYDDYSNTFKHIVTLIEREIPNKFKQFDL